MAKLTLSNLANLSNEASAVTTINNNSDAIETAIENTLSRDGTSPNEMGVDLDMNGFDIINVGNVIIDGDILTGDTVTDFADFDEQSPAPTSPSANTARVYAIDDGSGVTTMTMKDSSGNVSPLSHFLQEGTGTVTRTQHAKQRDLLSVKDWGAVGDGTTNDTTAITSADADVNRKYSPKGIYDVTLTASDLDGPYWGSGQIRDSANHLRGPWFSAIKAPPASVGNHDSVTTSFDGDLSKVQIAMEHRITGATTLGTPATGYQSDPEASPIYLNVFNSSGHNEQLSGNDGRTACAPIRIQMANVGQGDMLGLYINGVVANTLPGATHVLASPALSMFAGALFAGANGVYLNPAETQMHDNGFDVAALGWNMVMNRTNITGAIKAWWGGFRVQSVGTQPGNVAFQVVGPLQYGIDLVHGTYTNQAAISLKADNRIYGNSLVDTDSVSRFPASTGDDYLTFSSSLNAWNFVTDAVGALQVYTDRVASQVNLVVNHTAALAIGPSTTPRIQALATDGNGIGSARYSNGATGTSLFLSKSRGTTIGSNTIVQASDTFGLIRFCGTDGTNFVDGAIIEGRSDGTPGSGDMPGALYFSTTPDGTASAVERLRITSTGSILATAPLGGIGYRTGAGGAVTQATNRTTGVTLNTVTGQITTNNASLAAEAAAAFTVTNSTVAATDSIILSQASGSNGGNTDVIVTAVAAGSFQIKVCNNNAAAGTAETGAIVINFAVIKGVAA